MRALVVSIAMMACSSGGAAPAEHVCVHPAAVDVAPGGNVSVDVTVENGSSIVVTGAPSGVSAVFDGHTLTIAAEPSAVAGTFPLSLSTPGGSASAPLEVSVSAAKSSFTLSVIPAQITVAQGGQATATVQLTRSASFTGPVDVSFSSVPPGVLPVPFTIPQGETSAALRIVSEALAPVGMSGKLVVHASSGGTAQDVSVPITVSPEAGGLDTSFGNGGVVIETLSIEGHGPIDITSAAAQPDGKIVVVGDANRVATSYDVLVLRYNADGTVDPSFGTGGMVLTNLTTQPDFDVGTDVAIQSDGKIVVVGNHAYVDIAVIRYDASGNLDPTFGTGGIWMGASGTTYNTNGNGVAIAADGSIVVSGLSSGKETLFRLLPSGALDTGFATTGIVTGPAGGLAAVALQPDGKVLAAGWNASNWAVWRRNTDGTPDGTFASGGVATIDFQGGTERAQSLLLQPDGMIVVGGTAAITGNPAALALARLTTTGAPDVAFGVSGRSLPGGSGGVGKNPILLQPDGKILIGGGSTYGGSASMLLARVMPDGSIDSSFNGTGRAFTNVGGSTQWWRQLVRESDGRILTIGFATDPVDDVVMARYWP